MSETEQYFIEAILPCRHRMYAAALAITGSEDAAADIVQNVLLACWERLSSGHSIDAPMPYCLSAVRNRSIDEARRLSLLSPLDHAPEMPADLSPTGDYSLQAAMRMLPPREQKAIRMSTFAHCSSKEISEALHTSPDNTRQILSRARRRLRKFFESSNS